MTVPIADPAAPRGRDPIRRLIAATNPILRPLAGTRWFRLWGVIHHVGRKSGTPYATPIVVRPYRDGFVIPMPFGERTNWVNNVVAAGCATLRWAGRDYQVTDPRIVDAADAMDAFSTIQRALLPRFGIASVLCLTTVRAT
ncbi:MAG TPA: nitroreductase family deazaflavin-dependent oxidoreductase [Candidatus Limnocylindrales bacterium]|jgi:deazaflavin-dependent oxidoreductase (nitroreductase family)